MSVCKLCVWVHVCVQCRVLRALYVCVRATGARGSKTSPGWRPGALSTRANTKIASLARVAIGGRGAIGERKNEKTRCVLSSRSQQTRTFGKSTRPYNIPFRRYSSYSIKFSFSFFFPSIKRSSAPRDSAWHVICCSFIALRVCVCGVGVFTPASP